MARYQLIASSEGGGVLDLVTKTRIRKDQPGWDDYQAALTAGEVPLPVGIDATQDLAAIKARVCADIDSYAAGLRNKVIAGRSAGGMASWALKLLDAMTVAAGQPSPFAAILPAIATGLGLPETPTSLNGAIAAVRGITEAEHVGKVLAQCAPFMAAEAAIDGMRGKHCDAINAMTDPRDVVTYNWQTGWPSLGG